MAHVLGVCPVAAEAPSLVSVTTHNCQLQGIHTFFLPLCVPACGTHTYIQSYINTHTINTQMQKQGKCKTELQTPAPFYITISMSELSYKDEVYLIFKKSVSLMRSLEKTIE